MSAVDPMNGAKRSTVTVMSGRRRRKPRTYPSMSRMSRPKPPRGTSRGSVSSVKTAGSRKEAPYAAVEERTMSLLQPGRLLGGGEQLHRADDVLVLHRRPAALFGGADQGQVHERVGVEAGQQGHGGVETGADVFDAVEHRRQLRRRVGRVEADDPVDAGLGGEAGGDLRPEVAADAGDNNDPRRT